MKITEVSTQEEFSLNLHNEQRFSVIRAVVRYSVTWLVVMAFPRSSISLVLVELVFSYFIFRQGELIADNFTMAVLSRGPMIFFLGFKT